MAEIPWSDEDIQTLRQSVLDGIPYGKVVGVLMGKYSRSAIASKVARMGLRSGVIPRRSHKKKPMPGRKVTRISVTPLIERRESKEATGPIFFKDDPASGKGPYSILDLKQGMCKWPVEGGFCGEKTDRVYCRVHQRRSLRNV